MEKEKKVWAKVMAKATVFSSIKRIYGEFASAIKFQNMVKEMILKVSLYNV
jgi:hypothetical protein